VSRERRESPEEASAGELAENPELEAALQEAAEAIEVREREAAARRGEPAGAEGGEAQAPPAEAAPGRAAETVHEELARLREELATRRDQMLRLGADFENFRRRALKERQEVLLYGHQNLVKDLLSAVDNLERAIDHARASGGGDLESLLQGVELVRRELLGAMASHGVEEVDALGKPFDPAAHEAMSQVPSAEVAPNTILEVLQKGYRLRDRVVRPVRVVVARAPNETDQGGAGGAGEA
jgi:molecular chaperone GrpE